jgi:hypothetical protein
MLGKDQEPRLVEETDRVVIFESRLAAAQAHRKFGGELVIAFRHCTCGACDLEENFGVLFDSEARADRVLDILSE